LAVAAARVDPSNAIPSVAACWHTLDPETRLMTSDAPHELVSSGVYTASTVMAAGALLVASEYLVPDVNTFAGLARRRCWGAVHIARRDGQPDFTAADVAALGSITTLVAEGIRTSLRFDAGRRLDAGAAPGLVVLGPRDEVELITPPAYELLAAMRSGAQSDSDQTPPSSLLALAAFTRRGPLDPDGIAPGTRGPHLPRRLPAPPCGSHTARRRRRLRRLNGADMCKRDGRQRARALADRCDAQSLASRFTANSRHSPGMPFSSWTPRSSKVMPDPATRSLTVLETSTSSASA
jgi:hypothetical protein